VHGGKSCVSDFRQVAITSGHVDKISDWGAEVIGMCLIDFRLVPDASTAP